MPDINPYASPRADVEPVYVAEVIPEEHPPGVWRMGYLLVMTANPPPLPQLCMMTGGPAETIDETTITYLGATFDIEMPVSQEYKGRVDRNRTIATLLQVFGALGSVLMIGTAFGGAFFWGDPWHLVGQAASILCLALLGLGLWWGNTYSPELKVEHVTSQFVWLRGVHADYLKELPEWPYGAWREKRTLRD